jgi:hypothetical protein
MGRAFGLISTMIVMAVGMYLYSIQVKGVSSAGGGDSSAGAANIVGVKNDLIAIANAERAFYVSQQKYASLDELISGNYITIQRQRPPYTYDVDITPSGFHVTATRDSAGGTAQLWIDETMEVKSSN